LLFVIIATGAQLRAFARDPQLPFGAFTQTRGRMPLSAPAETLQRISRPDDPIAVWGWMPQILVQANRVHAPREAATALMIHAIPSRFFYRERYFSDFQRAPPPFFMDSVGPGNFAFENRDESGHEILPPLHEFITAHYRLMADVAGTRIYARLDRAEQAAELLRAGAAPAR
jgi:hypothetical protein